MAGRTGGSSGRPARPAARRTATTTQGAGKKKPVKASPKRPAPEFHGAPVHPGPFRLGAVEGATPGKWIDAWRQRMPRVALELTPLTVADQREALASASVDAALVRLPIDRTGLHIIELYDEVPVVVCAADSHLTAADELTLDDLAGEVVITPRHPPLRVEVAGAVEPRFAPPEDVGEAIAIAASGVGVVIVPMSLARLHHRKDADHRPLAGGPASTVALAWPVSPDGGIHPLVDSFIGIVRGRTTNSSR